MLKGNKGEWSEIYTLCYLLNSGVLYTADSDLNSKSDYYPILKILRKEYEDTLEYYPCAENENNTIKIYKHNSLILEINRNEIKDNIGILLAKIPNGQRAFEIPETKDFFNKIKVTKLKAASQYKQDIDMEIYDKRIGGSFQCGFSIKSYLGANPTLINPGKNTNFIYDVCNCDDVVLNGVNSIDTRTKLLDRMAYLSDNNCQLSFEGMTSAQFSENTQFIDSNMPNILASALKISYESNSSNGGKTIKAVVNKLKELNLINYSNVNMYEYKIKKFLCACALGMTPEKNWEGEEDANGGYIVVKQDGSIVCYHLYNRMEFEQYLYDYTCFDTPSTSRYDYMQIYKEDKIYKIKLNLQIRFI